MTGSAWRAGRAGLVALAFGLGAGCGGAVASGLVTSAPISARTTGGSVDWDLSCVPTEGPQSAWSFTPQAADAYRVHVDAAYDSAIAVFDGSVEIACNDDLAGSQRASEVTASLASEHAYTVVVGGYGGHDGDYSLRVDPTSNAVGAAAPSVAAPDLVASNTEPSGGARFADNRLGDRFWFGLYGGFALASADNVGLAATQTSSPGPVVGLESSFWPNDFLGLGLDAKVMFVTLPSSELSTMTADLGLYAVLAVPLRVVQLYAGGWAGIRTTSTEDQSSGVRLDLRPLAGMNVYVGRDVRIFGQWQLARLDFDEGTSRTYANAHAHEIVGGFRWSPEAFHESRAMARFSVLWAAMLAAVATFVVVSWIGS